MHIISKTFYWIFICLLISVAVLFLASYLPIPGNIEVKIVKSGSMEPAIKTGSIVILRPAESYAVGDIITFGEDTKLRIPTTHRIAEVHGSGNATMFTTKGDANEEADPQPVPLSSVIGKVYAWAPYAGYVIDFARTPWGFTGLIGVPAALIIIDELFVLFGEVSTLYRTRRTRREPENILDLRQRV
ncbi:signal peptidase I [Candidatus Kaiserbacteria bacterium]|nr:signal peptidase I [Candidatus Kaiserbacteria bacterium]